MALIKCYECAAEISDAAKSCPHCGAPQPQPEKQSVNLRKKATKAEPTTEEEVKDWKYYIKRIGGFIGILIAGKILSKIILTLF